MSTIKVVIDLNYKNGDPISEELTDEILEKLDIGYLQDVFTDGNQITSDFASLDDYEDGLRKISLEYPDVLFTIKGDGENTTDLWHGLACNGKYKEKEVEIVYPPITLDELE
jgi:hypothetical protein